MLIFLLLLIGLTIWSARSRAQDVWGFRPRVFVPIELALIALTLFLMHREHVSFDELDTLVDLPAGRIRRMHVPTGKEMLAWAEVLRIDMDTTGMADGPTYWIVETELPVDSVIAFYRGRGRRDWRIEAEYRQTLILERNGQTLRIFAGEPNWKPRTTILFSLKAAVR